MNPKFSLVNPFLEQNDLYRCYFWPFFLKSNGSSSACSTRLKDNPSFRDWCFFRNGAYSKVEGKSWAWCTIAICKGVFCSWELGQLDFEQLFWSQTPLLLKPCYFSTNFCTRGSSYITLDDFCPFLTPPPLH